MRQHDLILVKEMLFSLLQRYGEDGSRSLTGPLYECVLDVSLYKTTYQFCRRGSY